MSHRRRGHKLQPPRPYTCSACYTVTMVRCCEVPTRCLECGDHWFFAGVVKKAVDKG